MAVARRIPWSSATDIQHAIQYAPPTIDTATHGTSRPVSVDATDASVTAIPIIPRYSSYSSADAIDAATSIMAIESALKPRAVQSAPSMSV